MCIRWGNIRSLGLLCIWVRFSIELPVLVLCVSRGSTDQFVKSRGPQVARRPQNSLHWCKTLNGHVTICGAYRNRFQLSMIYAHPPAAQLNDSHFTSCSAKAKILNTNTPISCQPTRLVANKTGPLRVLILVMKRKFRTFMPGIEFQFSSS
jgi:hypothetical protein